MKRIRLTKEFSFEMSHALEGYDGPCRQIHGHSYRLFVTVIGTPCMDADDPKCGMVMDFGDLKRIVREEIIDRYDHAFLIRRTPENEELVQGIKEKFQKVELLDLQPTCENLIITISESLQKRLIGSTKLFSLRLHETQTSYAEWYASDNL